MFKEAYFNDDDAAREHLAAIRWPNGPVCPHCGGTERNSELKGKAHRPGVFKCYDCRKQFSVTVGTIFERSKIPLSTWFKAVYLLCSSKKGISSHQLHRMLGVTYKTAWFMTHRIREAMTEGMFGPVGGSGKIVEVDETFIGRDKTKKPKGEKKGRGYAHKHKVLTLVERGGQARSVAVNDLTAKTLVPILKQRIARETRIMTDEAGQYFHLHRDFDHDFVRDGQGEYVSRKDPTVHTNTIEGYFSIFKRGMKGTYQHCGERHLSRYLSEFDFRYNTRTALGFDDTARMVAAMKGIEGKRLMYGGPRWQGA